MPLIKPRPNRVNSVRHICRLKEPNRDLLVAYARFIGEPVDYVLNQLITTTLAKDRDFLVWRDEQPKAGSSASHERVTRPSPNRVAPENAA